MQGLKFITQPEVFIFFRIAWFVPFLTNLFYFTKILHVTQRQFCIQAQFFYSPNPEKRQPDTQILSKTNCKRMGRKLLPLEVRERFCDKKEMQQKTHLDFISLSKGSLNSVCVLRQIFTLLISFCFQYLVKLALVSLGSVSINLTTYGWKKMCLYLTFIELSFSLLSFPQYYSIITISMEFTLYYV